MPKKTHKAESLSRQLKDCRSKLAESERRLDELRGLRERTPKNARRDLEQNITREDGLRAGLATMLEALEGQSADQWEQFRKTQREAISKSGKAMDELVAIAGEIDAKLLDIAGLHADFDEAAKSLQPLFPHEECSAKRWLNAGDFKSAAIAAGVGPLFGASGRGLKLQGQFQTFGCRQIQAAAQRAAEECEIAESEAA